MGIGVVLGDDVAGRREMFVTQVFMRVPPKVDTAVAAKLVHARINAVRPVTVNAGLAKVAQRQRSGSERKLRKLIGRGRVARSLIALFAV